MNRLNRIREGLLMSKARPRQFTCYHFDDLKKHRVEMHPAPVRRAWMDVVAKAEAYRCLPLLMANQHGWEIVSPVTLTAVWNGGASARDLEVRADTHGDLDPPVFSHFGQGILSFGLPAILETPEGFNLWVSGPANRFKDGAQALSALIETDWMPYTFSINWKLTRPGTEIRFDQGEPIAMIFPVRRGDVEAMEPVSASLAAAPDLCTQAVKAMDWRKETREDRVHHQRWYMKGTMPDGTPGSAAHQTALRVKPFPPED